MRLVPRTLDLVASPIAEAHAWLAHRSNERELLDLSQAAPAYPTSPEIIRRVAEVASDPDGGRYAPPPGLPALNEAFAAEISRDYNTTISSQQVLPTGGCNQAFCVTTSALTEPGDEVILPLPFYFNHDMWLKLDGVTTRYIDPAPDFTADPVAAEAAITEKTRAIVLVTPANPTGAITPPETIRRFADIAERHDLALIVDETYRNFRSPAHPPHDLFSRDSWPDHVVSLHSFSKDLAIPGYRMGALVAGETFVYEVMKLVDCVQISAPRIGQEAVLAGLLHSTEWRQAQYQRIGGLLDDFQAMMATEPGGFRLDSAGAFFGWVRHPRPDLSSGEVVKRLVLDHDVLTIPGTAFTPTDEGYLRFSFANLDPRQLKELGNRLTEFSEKQPGPCQ